MRVSFLFSAILAVGLLLGDATAKADGVTDQMDRAKQAYSQGKLSNAAQELQKALAAVQNKMAGDFLKVLPAAPQGWTTDQPEVQGLGMSSGGFSITNTFTKGDQGITVSLVLDDPATEAALAGLLAAQGLDQAGSRKIKIGEDTALLHWDAEEKAGEVMMVPGSRALLQVEGSGMDKPDILVDVLKAFNISQLKKLLRQ